PWSAFSHFLPFDLTLGPPLGHLGTGIDFQHESRSIEHATVRETECPRTAEFLLKMSPPVVLSGAAVLPRRNLHALPDGNATGAHVLSIRRFGATGNDKTNEATAVN